jgi:hypothetical protein
MAIELGELRRGQVITTFGPGAIIDFRAPGKDGGPVSVVAGGLDQWDSEAADEGIGAPNEQTILEPRLQRLLNVKGFRLPPIILKNENGYYVSQDRLVGVRFPTWLFCAECHRLRRVEKWGRPKNKWDPSRICAECTAEKQAPVHALPVRFITICKAGHLDDFPWDFWVQHQEPCTSKKEKRGDLELVGIGSGMKGLLLSCRVCKASKTMDGCFSEDALKHLDCGGNRPWLGDKETGCDCTMRTVYRGASNVHFPVLVSALDIPPWSEELQKKITQLDWHRLQEKKTDKERLAYIEATEIHKATGFDDPNELLKEINARLGLLDSTSPDSIRPDEHRAFIKGGTGKKDRTFKVEEREIPAELTPFFSRSMSTTRLREVRAMKSFTRLVPAADWQDRSGVKFAAISREHRTWLPAAEVNGEGIFLELNGDAVRAWEARPDVNARTHHLRTAFELDWKNRYGNDEPCALKVTGRYLLVHALSHVLMRQMAIDSGYSSSSIRERLYVSDEDYPMCGLLLYTASSDADGTLGGLSRQALPDRLLALVVNGILSMEWCSNDPLCIQDVQSESEMTNGAACHACMMAPETGCERFNRLLDRRTLVGTPDNRDAGFFSSLLEL